MEKVSLTILNKENQVKLERKGEENVYLTYFDEYVLGDRILLELDKVPAFVWIQLDEALSPSLLYIKEKKWSYTVPMEEELRKSFAPIAFQGNKHYLTVRYAASSEISAYRNVAFNSHDQNHVGGAYPHASANVETRNESTFFAKNAIDGIIANESHGSYPFQSWGINQRADALLCVEFGRKVAVDRVAFVLRGDYPHDSHWVSMSLEFSDGSKETFATTDSLTKQYFSIQPRQTEWVKLSHLIKAEDESPFPALTQIEIYGSDNLSK